MVQWFPATSKAMANYQIGQAAGQNISKALNAYSMNKSLNEAMKSSEYKSGTPYERADVLQRALFGHGPEGQQFLQERMQLEGRRNFENALNKAKKLANDPKSSNTDILLALAETGVGGKELETFYNAIINQRASQNATKETRGGGTSQTRGGEKPTTTQRQPTNRQGDLTGQEAGGFEIPEQNIQPPSGQPPAPMNAPPRNNPTLEPVEFGFGPIPVIFSPDQMQDAMARDIAKNLVGDPRSEVAQMEKINEQERLRFQDQVNAANIHHKIGQANRVAENQFENQLASQLGLYGIAEGNTPYIKDPNDLAAAVAIATRPENMNIPNDTKRISKIKQEFEQYQDHKQNFKVNSTRPNPILDHDNYNKKLSEMKSDIDYFDKYNQRNWALSILAGPPPDTRPMSERGYGPDTSEKYGGWSESEIAKGTNPLPKSIENQIKTLPKMTNLAMSATPFGTTSQRNIEKQRQNEDKWKNFLVNNVKPGIRNKDTGQLKPGISLINLQNKAIENNVNPRDFSRWINDLYERQLIELDDNQLREKKLIGEGPGRTKSVYEYMMGK